MAKNPLDVKKALIEARLQAIESKIARYKTKERKSILDDDLSALAGVRAGLSSIKKIDVLPQLELVCDSIEKSVDDKIQSFAIEEYRAAGLLEELRTLRAELNIIFKEDILPAFSIPLPTRENVTFLTDSEYRQLVHISHQWGEFRDKLESITSDIAGSSGEPKSVSTLRQALNQCSLLKRTLSDGSRELCDNLRSKHTEIKARFNAQRREFFLEYERIMREQQDAGVFLSLATYFDAMNALMVQEPTGETELDNARYWHEKELATSAIIEQLRAFDLEKKDLVQSGLAKKSRILHEELDDSTNKFITAVSGYLDKFSQEEKALYASIVDYIAPDGAYSALLAYRQALDASIDSFKEQILPRHKEMNRLLVNNDFQALATWIATAMETGDGEALRSLFERYTADAEGSLRAHTLFSGADRVLFSLSREQLRTLQTWVGEPSTEPLSILKNKLDTLSFLAEADKTFDYRGKSWLFEEGMLGFAKELHKEGRLPLLNDEGLSRTLLQLHQLSITLTPAEARILQESPKKQSEMALVLNMPQSIKITPQAAHAWISLFLRSDKDLTVAFEVMSQLGVKESVKPILSFSMLRHPLLSELFKTLLKRTQSGDFNWDDIKPCLHTFLSGLEKGVGKFETACLVALNRDTPQEDSLYKEVDGTFTNDFNDILSQLYVVSAKTMEEMSSEIQKVNTEIDAELFRLRDERGRSIDQKRQNAIDADILALRTVQRDIVPILLSPNSLKEKEKNVNKLLDKNFKSDWLQDFRRVLLSVVTFGVFAYQRHQKVSARREGGLGHGCFFGTSESRMKRKRIEKLVEEPLGKKSKKDHGASGSDLTPRS